MATRSFTHSSTLDWAALRQRVATTGMRTQRNGHSADRDHLKHRWHVAIDRARLQPTLCEGQHVGRLHNPQRQSRARPQKARSTGWQWCKCWKIRARKRSGA